jgi:hypothetical protein
MDYALVLVWSWASLSRFDVVTIAAINNMVIVSRIA